MLELVKTVTLVLCQITFADLLKKILDVSVSLLCSLGIRDKGREKTVKLKIKILPKLLGNYFGRELKRCCILSKCLFISRDFCWHLIKDFCVCISEHLFPFKIRFIKVQKSLRSSQLKYKVL
jgi:hypothetical protein